MIRTNKLIPVIVNQPARAPLVRVREINCSSLKTNGGGGSSGRLKAHLNLVACVSTVTEKPRTPEVFLQVG